MKHEAFIMAFKCKMPNLENDFGRANKRQGYKTVFFSTLAFTCHCDAVQSGQLRYKPQRRPAPAINSLC